MSRARNWRHYTLRSLLLLTTLVALPACWVGLKLSEYSAEQRAVESMRKEHKDLFVRSTYFGPAWIPAGYRPYWLDRVWAVDVNGFMYGNAQSVYRYDRPFAFGDRDLAKILPDLQILSNLAELQVPYTDVSDASISSLSSLPNLSFVNAQQSLVTADQLIHRERGPELKISTGPKLPRKMSLVRNPKSPAIP